MIIENNQYPVVIQAYQPSGASDLFVAEQVIYNQAEADSFTSRYTGLLIKARKPYDSELNTTIDYTTTQRRRSGNAAWLLLLVLVLVALVVAGFTTGWIQRNTGITLQ